MKIIPNSRRVKPQKALSYIDKHLESALDLNTLIQGPPRKPEFRVSSLPYCPILESDKHFYPTQDSMNYGFSFYVNIGTAVHSVLQQFLPASSKFGEHVFGSWHCANCSQTKIHTFRPPNGSCTNNLPHLWIYDEIEFKYKGLSGHLDMLSIDPTKTKFGASKKILKPWWVAWEFKTTGSGSIKSGYNLPVAKHPFQIRTYCYLLRVLYNIKVKQFVIVYISRDRPEYENTKRYSYAYTDEMYAQDKQRIERDIIGNELLLKLVKTRKKLNAVKLVKQIVAKRPCTSKREYFRNMKPSFYGKENCTYFDSGQCAKSNGDTMEKVLLKSWKEREDE
jgi:hypothetical protein